MKQTILRRVGTLLVAAALLFALPVGASDNPPVETSPSPAPEESSPPVVEETKIALNSTELTLATGQERKLTLTITPEPEEEPVVAWSSDNPGVASVDGDGLVAATAVGNAVITARYGELTAECAVTVLPPVKSVTLNERDRNNVLTNLNELKMGVTVEPAGAEQGVIWKSSDEKVATVSEDGVVTPVGPGVTQISVTSVSDEEKTDTTTLTVSGVVLEPSEIKDLMVGKDANITMTRFGRALDIPERDWSSSNNNVASVSQEGRVLAREVGDTTIRVTVGTYSATCKVTVVENTDGLIVVKDAVTAGNPLAFSSGIVALLQAESKKAQNDDLGYVTNLMVPTTQGILYYGYNSPGDTGSGVGGTERYYYTTTIGQRSLSQVTFVPKAEFSGTAEIAYTARTKTGKEFSGIIRITVNPIEDVNYTAVRGTPVILQAGDFNTICRVRTGHDLNYLTFTLPSAGQGALYYNYNGEVAYAEKVIAGTQYFRFRSPYLDLITFVPSAGYAGTVRVEYRAVDTVGTAFNGRMTITYSNSSETEKEGDVTYTGSSGEAISFRSADFNSASRSAINETLDYVRFTLPDASQGKLYYNYRNASNPGAAVSDSTRYYRSGSPSISNITFVPASDQIKSVRIPFTGYGTGSGERFEGAVIIDYAGSGSSIQYTAKAGQAAEFEAADFNELCQSRLGGNLNYVVFDDLPSASRGTLYYNYSNTTGSPVRTSTRLHRSGSPSLSRVAFVPNSSYSGIVSIGFTAYDASGASFSGTVQIQVDEGSGSQDLAYSIRPGGSLRFDSDDFDQASRSVTGSPLSYVRFELPSASRGTLYYGSKSSRVSESTSYYRTGGSRLLDDVTFVATEGFTGTANVPYTGVSSNGGRFSGLVVITIATPRADTIYYTGSSEPIHFDGASFRRVCGAALNEGLSYVEFTGLPDGTMGRLYLDYNGLGTGTQITSRTSCYLNSAPSLDQVSFVVQPGYQGNVSIGYTAYDSKGTSIEGSVEIRITGNTASSVNFSDMGSNYSWAAPAVEYLARRGVVNGIGNGQFGPAQTIQRCDFVLMLCRAFGFNTNNISSFPDIPSGSYYAAAVATARDLGIVTGSNGLFMPTNALSRQDAMLMLRRAMQANGQSVPSGDGVNLSRFQDSAQISDYARSAVASMVQLGIVNGNEAGQLKPWDPITRAEMAVILYRVLAQ